MIWIETIEKYFNDIPLEQQAEVRDFLDEYYEKKDTHSATSLDGLSSDELSELLYLEINDKFNDDTIKRLGKCKKLKTLKINFTGFNLKHIAKLSNLRILELWLKEASSTLTSLVSLEKLLLLYLRTKQPNSFLGENFLPNKLLFFETEIEEEFQGKDYIFPNLPSNFSNLIYLNFYNSGIKNIPDLSWISNLVMLDLAYNQILEIPSHINRLTQLKELNLSGNKLTELPKEFFELKYLEVLHISHNGLVMLPFDISKLISLEILDISGNQLKTLPDEIFQLQNLQELTIFKNPFETPQILKDLNSVILDYSEQNEIFVLDLLKNLKPIAQDYNYFTLKVPKVLQTPMLQYIEFFKDYVEATKGKDIIFDIKRDEAGLVLVTNGNAGITLLKLGNYFQEYVSLVGQNAEDWVLNFEVPRNAIQADILHLKLDRQITSLKSDLNIARLESKFLSAQLSDSQAQINFLQELSKSLLQKINKQVHPQGLKTPNADKLLIDIIDQLVKMLERKYQHRLEDLHNDVLTDFLREQKYYATDQTRSGRAKISSGEIDIMIRKENGTPFSIIEAFRLSSCGEKNTKVAQHLDKLIHDYDTAGHARNFVVVYAEAKNFERLWKNYQTYVNELNGKIDFRATYPLISFTENEKLSEKSSIKIGVAKHRREGIIVEVYHVFVNMFGGLQ